MSMTLLIHFWNDNNPISVRVSGTVIPRVGSTQCLVVTVDEDMTWDGQISHILQKIQTNKYVLKMAKNYYQQIAYAQFILVICTRICNIA